MDFWNDAKELSFLVSASSTGSISPRYRSTIGASVSQSSHRSASIRTWLRYRALSEGTASSRLRSGLRWSFDPTSGSRSPAGGPEPGPRPKHHRRLKGLVHVVGDDVELPLRIAIQAVIAGPGPVAVAVDQDVIKRQEPEDTVDVEDRLEGFLELSRRCLVENPAQGNEGLPVRLVVGRRDLEPFLVLLNLLPQVSEAAVGARVPRNLPAGPLAGPILPRQESFASLAHTKPDAPARALRHSPRWRVGLV